MNTSLFNTQIKPLSLCIFAALSLPIAAQAADATDTIKEHIWNSTFGKAHSTFGIAHLEKRTHPHIWNSTFGVAHSTFGITHTPTFGIAHLEKHIPHLE